MNVERCSHRRVYFTEIHLDALNLEPSEHSVESEPPCVCEALFCAHCSVRVRNMTFITLSGSSRAATAAVACSVAALSIAGGLALLVQRHRKRTARSEQKMRTPAFVPEGCQKLVLERGDIFAAFESSLGLPVGTVTFFDFEGADLASCEKHLTEKFRSVVKANPWMVRAYQCLACSVCVHCCGSTCWCDNLLAVAPSQAYVAVRRNMFHEHMMIWAVACTLQLRDVPAHAFDTHAPIHALLQARTC